jgi:hypothetical protein
MRRTLTMANSDVTKNPFAATSRTTARTFRNVSIAASGARRVAVPENETSRV